MPVTSLLCSSNDNLLTETSSNNNTVKNFDQLPEYKLFNSNIPSIHSLLFGNTEQSSRSLVHNSEHDVREIEKRLMGMNKKQIEISYYFHFLFRKYSE